MGKKSLKKQIDCGSKKTEILDNFLSAFDELDQYYSEKEEILENIIKLLRQNYLIDVVSKQQEKLFSQLILLLTEDSSDRLKQLTVQTVTLMTISLNPENNNSYKLTKEVLSKSLNSINDTSLKATYIYSLSLLDFVYEMDKYEIIKVIQKLFNSIRYAYDAKLDKEFFLLEANLLSIGLLITKLDFLNAKDDISDLFIANFKFLIELIDHSDTDVRITSGENLALFYECLDKKKIGKHRKAIDLILIKLNQILSGKTNYKSRRDKRYLKDTFKEILSTVEGENLLERKLKYKGQSITLKEWSKIKQLNHFYLILESGLDLHLKENVLLVKVFDNELIQFSTQDPSCLKIRNFANSSVRKERVQSKSWSKNERRLYLEEHSIGLVKERLILSP